MRISDYSCKYFSNNATLSSFLNDVRKYSVPSTEDEIQMINDYKNGNEEAGQELVCCHLRFIYSLAKIYARDENEVVDYVNEGVIGFREALKDFDINRGYKFITYAVWYIRREMNYYLMKTRNIINRSNSNKIGKKIDIIKQKYFAEIGKEPSIDEIKTILEQKYNIEIKNEKDLYDINVTSINEELDDDYTIENDSQFTNATASVNIYENEIEKEYVQSFVKSAIQILPQKQADIIKMFYGIDYDRSYSIEEIGEKYGIISSEVQKLKDRIIKYMQQNITKIKVAAM